MASKSTVRARSKPTALPRLSRYHLASRTEAGLTSLFNALLIDTQVPGYKDIAEILSSLLADEVLLPPGLSRRWNLWRKLNSSLLALGDRLDRWANPTEGKAKKYPITTCLLTKSARPQEYQIKALMQLLLMGCMLLEAGLPVLEAVTNAADEIRRACEEIGERMLVAIKLPIGPIGLPYLISLRENTSELFTKTVHGSRGRRFVLAIQVLLDVVLSSKNLVAKRKASAKIDADDTLTLLGSVEAVVTAGERENAGEFEQVNTFEERNAEPGGELSYEGLEAAAIQSRYWLTQTLCGVLWQRGRISPREWPSLQATLHNLPTLVKKGVLTLSQAIVFALVAATGQDVKDILTLNVGRKAALTWSGQYKRRIEAPDDAFQPPEEALEWFESAPVAEVIWDLPSTVKILLAAAGTNSPATATTLGAALGFTMDNPKNLKKTRKELRGKIGWLLREQVNNRLEHRHLKAVLRHNTFDQTQDPWITYLIAGRRDQTAPVQMYYARISVAHLEKIHRNVTGFIFGEL